MLLYACPRNRKGKVYASPLCTVLLSSAARESVLNSVCGHVPWQSCWEVLRVKELLETCRMAVSKPIETGCGASEMPDSSFKANRNTARWQFPTETGRRASESPMAKLLGVLRFKGCWKCAGWQFRSPIETGCSASQMPDSSFEAQQKHCQMAVSNRNSSWGLGKSHGKAAGRF